MLHRKYKAPELVVPIKDKSGTLSRNLDETLENWTKYYSELYKERKTQSDYRTSEYCPGLDHDFTQSEFLDSIYSLKYHKTPGADHITNDDIISFIPQESDDDQIDSEDHIDSEKQILHGIFFSKSLLTFGSTSTFRRISREQY